MKQQKRILFINRVYPPARGATGRVLKDLARGFVTKGWRVTILSVMSDPKDALDVKPLKGIDYYPISSSANPRSMWGIFSLLRKIAKTGRKMPKHDVVVSMTDPPMLILAAQRIAQKYEAKHIHWCQDVYPDLARALDVKIPNPLYKLCHKASRRAMKRADRVIAIGRCMARHLKRTGVDPQRISVIPNWADLILYRHPNHKSKKTTKSSSQSDKFKILYAGNLGRAHPYESIVETAHTLSQSLKEVEFVFAGQKDLFDPVIKKRDELRLSNMRFLPYQPLNRLQELLKGADVHLISMDEDVQGMLVPCKFYSALAAARPSIFIGPKDCEIGIVIKDFECGVVVPQDRPDLLAKAIKDYLDDADLWFKHQQGAFKAAQTLKPSHSINAWITRAETTLSSF